MSLSNKNLIVISITVVIGLVLILMTQPFMDEFVYAFLDNNSISKYFSGIIIRFIILLLAIFVIAKLKLLNFAGLTGKIDYRKSKIFIAPILFLIILVYFLPYDNLISYQLLYSFIIFQLMVGFAEEFSMRGILLPVITKIFINSKNAIYFGLIISSFVFAIIHYLSFISGIQTFESATNQVILAFGIGVYFGSLLLRSNNIILISLLHGFVNIIGRFSDITYNSNQLTEFDGSIGFTINFVYIICLVTTAIGLYLIRNVKKSDLIEKAFDSNTTNKYLDLE
jgi:uncharacterized protein